MPEMVAPRAVVFRPLVKGNEDSGNEIASSHIIVDGSILQVFHAIAVRTLKTLKLRGIIIIVKSVHDERPRTRTGLPACIVFHVTLTSVDSYRCDSHCLARLFENLPAPPKHYGVFDVLPIRKVFAKAKNLRSH